MHAKSCNRHANAIETCKGRTSEIMATYVDDSLAVGDEDFDGLTKITKNRFEKNTNLYDNLRFSGVCIESFGECDQNKAK